MLKFFRKYNKWILAVGACFLMVTFLVDPSMWASGGGDGSGEPIGRIGERSFTVADQRQAAGELIVLRRIGLPTLTQDEAELNWLLMSHEADQLGIEVSELEVETILALLGLDESQLTQLARGVGVSTGFVRQAIARWAGLQQYRELVMGLGHQSLQDRLSMYMTAANLFQQAGQVPEFMQRFYVQQAAIAVEAASGKPRVSEPMLQRLALDQLATVTFVGLAIPAGKVLPEVGQPDPAVVQKLFDDFKDKLPATEQESNGLPFGYRTPDRVKIEYLALPLAQLADKVQVSEADAYAYYEANKDRFRAPPKEGQADLLSRGGELQPYREVRERIISSLQSEQAGALADRVMKAARGQLLEQARGLVERDGYREIPDGFVATSLQAVAEAIERDPQFGVKPDVRSLGDRWLDGRALSELPGIGRSAVPGARPIPFPSYVLSAKEISPDSPLATMTRLQAGMPSLVLEGMDGTRYLFRITDAQPARTPASLDEVREQVVSDARRLAAYELLQANQQQWIDKALATADWKVAADEWGATYVESGSAPRREFAGRGQPQPPLIDGVGRSERLIDSVFEKAYALVEGGSIKDAPVAQRVGAAASDPALSLVVFRVDDFTPIPRSRYEQESGSPLFSVLINEAMKPSASDDLALDDPLSVASLSKRLGYVPARAEGE